MTDLRAAVAAARVLVVGDLVLDSYLRGEVRRVSREAPVPIVLARDTEYRPGGAGNAACNLAAMGAGCALAATVGQDEAGARLQALLDERGVQALLQRHGGDTTVKQRVVGNGQQVLRIDWERPADDGELDLGRLDLTGYDAILLSDYAKGAVRDPQRLIALAGETPVLVDPRGEDFAKYAGARLLTPNRQEFLHAARLPQDCDDKQLRRAAEAMRGQLGLRELVVTLGPRGMLLLDGDGEARHLPAASREVYDVTGAGDTVIAWLCGCLAAGAGLDEAARLANAAAAVSVGRFGAATVAWDDLPPA